MLAALQNCCKLNQYPQPFNYVRWMVDSSLKWGYLISTLTPKSHAKSLKVIAFYQYTLGSYLTLISYIFFRKFRFVFFPAWFNTNNFLFGSSGYFHTNNEMIFMNLWGQVWRIFFLFLSCQLFPLVVWLFNLVAWKMWCNRRKYVLETVLIGI